MAINLSTDKVIESWNVLIRDAAGRGEEIFDFCINYLTDVNPPGVTGSMDRSAGGSCLVLTHKYLQDYYMYISARDYGTCLAVNWVLTVSPSFFNKTFAKVVPGVHALIYTGLDYSAQMELGAYTTVVHQGVKDAVNALMEGMNQDFSKVNTRSRGVLELW
jgi:hypothetical protein